MWILFVLLIVLWIPEIIEVVSQYFTVEREMSCVKIIRLVKLRQLTDTKQHYYIQIMGNKVRYAFNNSKNYLETYKEKTVKGKIEVREDEACDEPVLREFQQKPVYEQPWPFSPSIAKTKYVFYIPKGTALWGRKTYEKKELDSIVV